jgi:sec-independent protein translocase protein TatA
MQVVATSAVMLAFFGLGAWEIILILTLAIILFGARRLPGLGRGLRLGIREFRRATREVTDEMDEAASEAGRSVGGIYGKPAAEALTADNQVAELYDPAVLRGEIRPRRGWVFRGLMRLHLWIRRLLLVIDGGRDRSKS